MCKKVAHIIVIYEIHLLLNLHSKIISLFILNRQNDTNLEASFLMQIVSLCLTPSKRASHFLNAFYYVIIIFLWSYSKFPN